MGSELRQMVTCGSVCKTRHLDEAFTPALITSLPTTSSHHLVSNAVDNDGV